jgi:hypothetical protein
MSALPEYGFRKSKTFIPNYPTVLLDSIKINVYRKI